MSLDIRDATADDEAAWRDLWRQYLAFYQVTLPPEVTDHTWARILDSDQRLTARVACRDGAMLGFALHHHHASTWVLGDDCYLEDLFVAPVARGQGIGRALIEDVKALAWAKGWHRLYWHTDEGNTTARKLYDSFAPSDGHIRYRLKL
ncbi:GNAT family N-acetyltransferase [Rhodobacter ferrooxidans]|uniref:GCN5-related N-acetyltransferase n=1 Tax=Rhodobacter ferrooxidans TaxID=371731 RepID=C8RZG9_9RHOB|nr:GNAT family N-acetyltransferase [Rhodobacter sp. SW2]EEW25766.1 GCN5-related N-acetyltransferase [Rhodobacter sp. SW2]